MHNIKSSGVTNCWSLQWHFLLLFFFVLLLLLLLLVLLSSSPPSSACERGALALLHHQAPVVLITGVVPGGLTRREVEVVDVPRHVLAATKKERKNHFELKMLEAHNLLVTN